MMERTASIKRDTKETRIALTLSLDGTGSADIDTGICLLYTSPSPRDA